MKTNTLFVLLFFVCSNCLLLVSCSSNIASLPDKPISVDQVKNWIAAKKYTTEKTGMYGSLTINEKTEIAWIDIKSETDKFARETAEEEQKFSIQFLNDTAATVTTKDTSFAAIYAVDDKPGEDEEQKGSIKLRLQYEDPSFSLGEGIKLSKVTYTYLVLGADEKRLLLQLPKSINRKPLISLLEAK